MATPDLMHSAQYGGRNNGSAYGSLFRTTNGSLPMDSLAYSRNLQTHPTKLSTIDYKYGSVPNGDVKHLGHSNNAWMDTPKSSPLSGKVDSSKNTTITPGTLDLAINGPRNNMNVFTSDRVSYSSSTSSSNASTPGTPFSNSNKDFSSSSPSPSTTAGEKAANMSVYHPPSATYVHGYERLLSSVSAVPKTLDNIGDKTQETTLDPSLTQAWNLPRRSDHTNYNTHQKYSINDSVAGITSYASPSSSNSASKTPIHSDKWESHPSVPFKEPQKAPSTVPPSTDYVSKWQEKRSTSFSGQSNWMSMNPKTRSFEMYSTSPSTQTPSTVANSTVPTSTSFVNHASGGSDFSVSYHTPMPPKTPNPYRSQVPQEKGMSALSIITARMNDKSSEFSERASAPIDSSQSRAADRISDSVEKTAVPTNILPHRDRVTSFTERPATPYSILPSRTSDYSIYLDHALSKPATNINSLQITPTRYSQPQDGIEREKDVLSTSQAMSAYPSEASTRSLNAHIDELILGHTSHGHSAASVAKPILKKKSSYESHSATDRSAHRNFLNSFSANDIPAFPARGSLSVVQKRLPPLGGSAGSLGARTNSGKRVTFNMGNNTSHWYEAAVYDEPYNLAYLY